MAGKKPRPVGPRDEMGGREVEAPPMKGYERGQDTGQGTTTYRSTPFEAPPAMPPGVSRGRGMSDAEVDTWLKNQPKDFCKGGKVISSRKM